MRRRRRRMLLSLRDIDSTFSFFPSCWRNSVIWNNRMLIMGEKGKCFPLLQPNPRRLLPVFGIWLLESSTLSRVSPKRTAISKILTLTFLSPHFPVTSGQWRRRFSFSHSHSCLACAVALSAAIKKEDEEERRIKRSSRVEIQHIYY